MKTRLIRSLLATALLLGSTAHADVNSDLNHFFGKLGFEGNSSMPQVWQGQVAGYASGGSMYMRTSVKEIQIMSMTVPSLNSGCGGIDAYLGAFSYINGEQLQRFVKQIMGNAAGYFFDLALETTVPEMKTAKDFLQKMAGDMNSLNMSSCQAAQGIIGGLMPRSNEVKQKVCQDIAGETNAFADWAASRQGCTVGGSYDNVTDKAPDNMKDQVPKNKNLIWDSLSSNSLFSGNRELQEFAMSVTGSLIFDGDSNVTTLTPLVADEDVMNAMMEGGEAKIYRCDTTDLCLKPTISTVSIDKKNSMSGQVTALLTSIQNKAILDSALSDNERSFIGKTSIPVLKYLVDPQSLGVANSQLYQLADYIGYDILQQYLNELIQQAKVMLASKSYPAPAVEQLQTGLADATRSMAEMQGRVQVQQNALLVVDRQMNYMRQQVSGRLLERYQSNYHFNKD